MSLIFESRTYRIIGTTPILGSSPAAQALRTQYIMSKAPTEQDRAADAENAYDLDERGLTVFQRDKLNRLCLRGYQIKGFLKQAFKTAKLQLKIANPQGKVDKHIFVEPVYIPIIRDGKPIYDEDEILERSLRADTPMGERTALVASEMVNDPWEVTIQITLIPNDGTAKSKAVDWDALETALDYGMFNGLGQWRNADYGKFRWERIAD